MYLSIVGSLSIAVVCIIKMILLSSQNGYIIRTSWTQPFSSEGGQQLKGTFFLHAPVDRCSFPFLILL